MTNMLTKTLKGTMLPGFVAAFTLVVPIGSAVAQQAADSPTRLAALARDARTSSEHARVAKGYRLQAESFDAQAGEYESRVAKLSRNQPGITHKWPAMAPPDLVKAKQHAMDARKAARQSRELASHHLRMSLEANADE